MVELWYLLFLAIPAVMFLASSLCALSAQRLKKKVGEIKKQKDRKEYADILFIYSFEMLLVFGFMTVVCVAGAK